MYEFKARGSRQLDVCLRMLYDAGHDFLVRIVKNEKNRIEYRIDIRSDEATFNRLQERYDNLIR